MSIFKVFKITRYPEQKAVEIIDDKSVLLVDQNEFKA